MVGYKLPERACGSGGKIGSRCMADCKKLGKSWTHILRIPEQGVHQAQVRQSRAKGAFAYEHLAAYRRRSLQHSRLQQILYDTCANGRSIGMIDTAKHAQESIDIIIARRSQADTRSHQSSNGPTNGVSLHRRAQQAHRPPFDTGGHRVHLPALLESTDAVPCKTAAIEIPRNQMLIECT